MQADQSTVIKTVIWTGIVLLAVLIVGGLMFSGNFNSKLKLVGDKFDKFDVDENAIANAILAGIEVPDYPNMPEFDTGKLDNLWEGVYSDEIKDLELDAIDVSDIQFEDDNGVVYPDNFFTDENGEIFELLEEAYEDDYEGVWQVKFIRVVDNWEVEVINLGLEDEDDREVELSATIKVRVYTDIDDDEEYEFDRVYLNSVVTSDDEVLEAELTYSL